jgi:hypothetical protein
MTAKKKPSTQSRRPRRKPATKARQAGQASSIEVREVEHLAQQLEKSLAKRGTAGPPKWNADPDDVQRSVAKLVLTLVEFLRKLLERQAIRRMENETLSPKEIEEIGLALMRLEETVRELGVRFGLTPDDLNLELGPLGRLM